MPKPRRGDVLSITIDDLAFGAEGVGRADGYVVFVRGGVPGDRLTVRVTETRARYARGIIETIEAPSPDRVEAPCPYFGRCGGCRLQHVAYTAQLAFKAKQVRDCLERLGGLGEFELRPILAAPDPYGYRNKMEFTIAPAGQSERRGGPGFTPGPPSAGGAGAMSGPPRPSVGLHEADRYDVVVDIDRCLLQSETMNALLDAVRSEIRERALSVWDPAVERGLLRFVTIREGRRTGQAMVNLVASAPDVEALTPVAERLHGRVPATASVVLNVNAKKAAVAVGTEEHLLLGREHIHESLGGLRFAISAGSFFQTNTVQAERLFGIVEEACGLSGGETVVDLYSGTGAISLLLARRCRHVYGIELLGAAVTDANANARANGIDNCTFLAGEVRYVLPQLLREHVAANVAVADPPRAGFHPKALQALVQMAPARIVYVSCNPATLARDVADLVRGGYRLDWVQPVDMFPQTPHIEAVARLRRAA